MSKEYKKEKKWSKDRRTTAHRSISLSFVSRWKDGRFVSSNTPLHALVNEYVGGNVPAHPVFTNTLAQIRTQARTRARPRRVEELGENSSGRSICMLVFFQSLECFPLLSIPTRFTYHAEYAASIKFFSPLSPLFLA